jgi:hypothetical protein
MHRTALALFAAVVAAVLILATGYRTAPTASACQTAEQAVVDAYTRNRASVGWPPEMVEAIRQRDALCVRK